MKFLQYILTADAICMGERMKGGLVRPCSKTIRYSQISGALREHFGLNEIHAVGHLINVGLHNRPEYIVYSPRDNIRGVSKIPLQIQVLTNVKGRVYILKTERVAQALEEKFEIMMGAFRSKGLGRCKLELVKEDAELDSTETQQGLLNTRIPILPANEEEFLRLKEEGVPSTFLRETFGVIRIINPVFGYLFQPDSQRVSGKYVISLFQRSEIIGPKFLVRSE